MKRVFFCFLFIFLIGAKYIWALDMIELEVTLSTYVDVAMIREKPDIKSKVVDTVKRGEKFTNNSGHTYERQKVRINDIEYNGFWFSVTTIRGISGYIYSPLVMYSVSYNGYLFKTWGNKYELSINNVLFSHHFLNDKTDFSYYFDAREWLYVIDVKAYVYEGIDYIFYEIKSDLGREMNPDTVGKFGGTTLFLNCEKKKTFWYVNGDLNPDPIGFLSDIRYISKSKKYAILSAGYSDSTLRVFSFKDNAIIFNKATLGYQIDFDNSDSFTAMINLGKGLLGYPLLEGSFWYGQKVYWNDGIERTSQEIEVVQGEIN